MTGAEIAVVEARVREAQPVTLAGIELWRAQAEELASSDMVPAGYRGRPANIVAAAMIGSELGWTLTRSLLNIHSWTSTRKEKVWDPDLGEDRWVSVEEPTTAISTPAKLSLLTTAGHAIAIVEHSERECSIIGERCDRPCRCPEPCTRHYPVTVGIGDPDLAHLVGRGSKGDRDYLAGKRVWRQMPKRMLWWRAVSELVAVMCPEVVMGMTAAAEDAPPAADVPTPTSPPTATAVEAPAAPAELAAPEQPPPKVRAMTAVLDALGGDKALAAECWSDLTARGSWLLCHDHGAWAKSWLAGRAVPADDPADDPADGPAGEASRCGHLSRDGRQCLRERHDSRNHRYPPPDETDETAVPTPDPAEPAEPAAVPADAVQHPAGDGGMPAPVPGAGVTWPDDHEPF